MSAGGSLAGAAAGEGCAGSARGGVDAGCCAVGVCGGARGGRAGGALEELVAVVGGIGRRRSVEAVRYTDRNK